MKKMSGAPMPKKEFEQPQGKLGHPCGLKYSGEMSAPKDYDRANIALANYVKTHQMKY